MMESEEAGSGLGKDAGVEGDLSPNPSLSLSANPELLVEGGRKGEAEPRDTLGLEDDGWRSRDLDSGDVDDRFLGDISGLGMPGVKRPGAGEVTGVGG